MGAARAVRELVLPELDGYFGHGFDRLCREALASLYAREGVRAGFAAFVSQQTATSLAPH